MCLSEFWIVLTRNCQVPKPTGENEDVPVVVDSDASIGENPGWHAFGFAEVAQSVVAFRV